MKHATRPSKIPGEDAGLHCAVYAVGLQNELGNGVVVQVFTPYEVVTGMAVEHLSKSDTHALRYWCKLNFHVLVMLFASGRCG